MTCTDMKNIIALATTLALLVCCKSNEKEFDATGVFEATEVTVSAEQSGTLQVFNIDEGDNIASGQEVGLTDTMQIWLKLQQAEAQKTVFQSQKPDVEKQIAATRQQLAKAKTEQQRYQELVADGAAPSKMLDDARNQVQVLQRQLDAQISSLKTSTNTLNQQIVAADVLKHQLKDQLQKCHITAPVSGTVLEKYVEQGEFVTSGKPLFKLGDMTNMYLRAYVTSGQLQQIKIGQKVKTYADFGNGKHKEYDGIVTWISSRSEFTPKTILTDDERADLVYAVKIQIKNDGVVKVGMYGEVKL